MLCYDASPPFPSDLHFSPPLPRSLQLTHFRTSRLRSRSSKTEFYLHLHLRRHLRLCLRLPTYLSTSFSVLNFQYASGKGASASKDAKHAFVAHRGRDAGDGHTVVTRLGYTVTWSGEPVATNVQRTGSEP